MSGPHGRLVGDEVQSQLCDVMRMDGSVADRIQKALEIGTEYLDAEHGHVTQIDRKADDWESYISIRPNGPVGIRLPTRLDEETWTDLLADEFGSEGGHVYDNVTVSPGDPYDTVTISPEGNASHDLRLGRVRVGEGTGQPGPHHITVDSPARASVPVGPPERVTVGVRDRYNNPVSGVTVNASIVNGPGTVPVTATTDEDGHATFPHITAVPETATVNATFGSAPGGLETATVTVEAVASGGGVGDATGPLVTDVDTSATATSGQTSPAGRCLTSRRPGRDVTRQPGHGPGTLPGRATRRPLRRLRPG